MPTNEHAPARRTCAHTHDTISLNVVRLLILLPLPVQLMDLACNISLLLQVETLATSTKMYCTQRGFTDHHADGIKCGICYVWMNSKDTASASSHHVQIDRHHWHKCCDIPQKPDSGQIHLNFMTVLWLSRNWTDIEKMICCTKRIIKGACHYLPQLQFKTICDPDSPWRLRFPHLWHRKIAG